MSIDGEIRNKIGSLVNEGRLSILQPGDKGWGQLRTMFVSQEVSDFINPPFGDTRDGERLSEFRATLDDFVVGIRLSVAENPFKKPSSAMLARVHPANYEIWDVRCTAPDPGIRCLGSFAGKDTFVALTWDYREEYDEIGWKKEIERCKTTWQKFFGSIKPFKGRNLDEYFSENYFPV